MKAAIIIPARFASTRLPGKLLLSETGKPLIQHVYERALAVASASAVIIATDDKRIFDVVRSFGGDAMMTSPNHESGSARIAEAAHNLDADIIINLQGDEPEIDPEYIERLINVHRANNVFASTLACPFSIAGGPGSPTDNNAVKAILAEPLSAGARRAAYFTRALGVAPRTQTGAAANPGDYFLHLGLYAFSRQSLQCFAAAPQGALERAERLEQLRILEMGESIAVGLVERASPGVDTAEDYRAFVARAASAQ